MADQKPNTSSQLHAELQALADALDEVLQSTTDKTESELTSLKLKAEQMLKSSRHVLSDTGERLTAQTKELAERTDSYVREKPWNSIGIAAAVGLALGILLSRR